MELSVVLVLMTLLAGLGIASWRPFLAAAENEALLRQLQAALHFARQEALLRREVIVLCGSHNQEACTGDWQQGVLVFIDMTGGEIDSGQILRVFLWGRLGGVLHWRAFPRSQSKIEFLPSGASNYENGTFWYCSKNTSHPTWALVLAQSGHWRIRYPGQDGSIRDEKGLALPCEGAYQHSFSLP